MFRVTKSKAAATLAIAMMAVPSAAQGQDLRSADALDASIRAESQAQTQDLRSADALDASIRAESRQASDVASPDPRDLRSPDARDAAEGRGTFSAPEVTVVRVSEPTPSPSGGLDWGDAGIGAASLLGLILIGLGGTLFVLHRRQVDRPTAA
jgi:hypothetical protein